MEPRTAGIVLAVLLAGGIGAYLYFGSEEAVAPPPPAAAPDPVLPGTAPDAGALADVDPADGAELLRKSIAEARPSAMLARWLEAQSVLQRIAVAVNFIAQGRSPRSAVEFIDVRGDFTVVEDGGRLYIAAPSYARYDPIREAVTSIDAAVVGRIYVQVRPYFDALYAQMAGPNERFDTPLGTAIQHLGAARIPDGRIEVVEKGALYAFADPALESLSPAQKHLLRMGPANARAIQDALRRFAESAGVAVPR